MASWLLRKRWVDLGWPSTLQSRGAQLTCDLCNRSPDLKLSYFRNFISPLKSARQVRFTSPTHPPKYLSISCLSPSIYVGHCDAYPFLLFICLLLFDLFIARLIFDSSSDLIAKFSRISVCSSEYFFPFVSICFVVFVAFGLFWK